MEPEITSENEFHGKLLPFARAAEALEKIRSGGKKVVHCHGTFDLIHPGHIYHLEEAKEQGDILVATVTGEEYVNKGPGRPYFNDHLRVKALTELECVDYVVVIPFPAAVEAIECVRPNIYCKGKEYEDAANDPTGNILDDVKAVERVGGEIAYIGSVVFSSTKLLNRHFESHTGSRAKQFCAQLAEEWTPDRVRQTVDEFQDLKVVVLGDIIFDRYEQVRVQGLTSKSRVLSARHAGVETQPGGSLAVFRHVKEFTPNVKLISVVGEEPWAQDQLRQYLEPGQDLVIRDPDFTTIVKHRFVEMAGKEKEIGKLFSVNYLNDGAPGQAVQERLLDEIGKEAAAADVVLVMDFGHGLMQAAHRRLVEQQAKFMALNCQTNSYNHGFNVIDKQYHRADSFSLDQAEITLSCGKREADFQEELTVLQQHFDSKYAWLTRGEVATIGLHDAEVSECPPLERVVTDTVGAGDAFCSVATLAAAKNLPIDIATFFGQVAGALAVKIIGNRDCIDKGAFLKSATTLLNY